MFESRLGIVTAMYNRKNTSERVVVISRIRDDPYGAARHRSNGLTSQDVLLPIVGDLVFIAHHVRVVVCHEVSHTASIHLLSISTAAHDSTLQHRLGTGEFTEACGLLLQLDQCTCCKHDVALHALDTVA